ncbi:AcrR family transcriptional regulator [Novimethylophilus kurashikiensis]|uniref:AcrR family transcriptional regulator n=1 Tax=Novimethylophilus kurashikiensis TaxID=1825523 RepID=A0A2R5F4H0_9PROT|nr:TetR/AcrR family transcriptional regulator [Novimethylophilus kurashikiensis]GBG12909.1 AcrR family transcriptional regulator [Novimethylophilus kurashikiensis]
MNKSISKATPLRGPADHNVRTQIVEAAEEHFSHYGYEKTTVSDLAKSIGFSKAYIYKFFESKQAIGEVICGNCLNSIITGVKDEVEKASSPSIKFRHFFKKMVASSVELFFQDRKLYEIAAFAASENWAPTISYGKEVKQIIETLVREGRETGEFERKTPIDETVDAIYLVMRPFINPLLLQYNLDLAEEAPSLLSALVLRSLAP